MNRTSDCVFLERLLQPLLTSIHHLETPSWVQIADLTTERKIADNVVEAYVSCVSDERDTMLYYLLCMHPGRTLVFLNAISGVRRVSALLKALDINVQVQSLFS